MDKTYKLMLRTTLLSFIYSKGEQEQQDKLDRMVDKNCVLQETGTLCFMYKCILYKGTGYHWRQRGTPRLHASLREDITDYLNEAKAIANVELPYVTAFLNTVLNSSPNLKDYLRVLPSSIHDPIEKLIAEEQLITGCGYTVESLSEAQVQEIITTSKRAISFIKERLMLNLIM